MKHLVILGGGTAGTILANLVQRKLPAGWRIRLIEPRLEHVFQPGLLYVPFGGREEPLMRRRERTLASGLEWVVEEIAEVDSVSRKIITRAGRCLPYDLLVIATGAEPRLDLTPGLAGSPWARGAHEFHTLEGAHRLREALGAFRSGHVVVISTERPSKGPLAPLGFLFLVEELLRKRGLRDEASLTFAAPCDPTDVLPMAGPLLRRLLRERGIEVRPFLPLGVDAGRRLVHGVGGNRLPYDLLVSVPVHRGASMFWEHPLSAGQGFIRTDPKTLAAEGASGVFALGDAAALPTHKLGSAAHFQARALSRRLLAEMAPGRHSAREPAESDGHAMAFLPTENGRAMLIETCYGVDALSGVYPWGGVGPLALLGATRRNQWANRALRELYFAGLPHGLPLPLSSSLRLEGKRLGLTRD